MPPKMNLKQQAGLAKKAENESKKQAAVDAQRAAQEDAAWKDGANLKKQSRADGLAAKQDEALQRRRERDALLAAEEASGPSTTSTAKKAVQASKASKKKNDLSFLEDSLVSAADKKAKQKKAAEAAAKQKAEQEAKLKAEKLAQEKAGVDPLFANTEAMIGGADDETSADLGRDANKARMDLAHTTGIDAALDHLNIACGPVTKVTYADFEERMLPVVKSENPGLRLSQYKEKVYNLWKKSPENPANQIPQP